MRRTLVLLAALLAASCGKSADQPTPATATAAAPARWQPTTHPGCLDPGDLLEVRVPGLSNDPGTVVALPVHVQADGTVGLPLLPRPVPVAYADRADVARRVADAYRAANVLADAVVDVRRLAVAGGSTPGPIAPFDLVRCSVAELGGHGTGAVSVGRVDGRGRVVPPLLSPVPVAGLTEADAAAALAKAYRTANMISSAQVSVLVLERAPPDAARRSLPDGPVDPVDPLLRDLYLPR